LRRELKDAENAAARSRRTDQRTEILNSMTALKPGDVIDVPVGKFAGYAVVIDPGSFSDREGPRPYVVTVDRHARRLSLVDFSRPIEALARLRVPKSFNGRNPQMRRDLAAALRERTRDLPRESVSRSKGRLDEASEREIAGIRERLRAHPCHQ